MQLRKSNLYLSLPQRYPDYYSVHKGIIVDGSDHGCNSLTKQTARYGDYFINGSGNKITRTDVPILSK